MPAPPPSVFLFSLYTFTTKRIRFSNGDRTNVDIKDLNYEWGMNTSGAICSSHKHGDDASVFINPLTPELNPSAQRCLSRFLLGILLLEQCISLTYAWNTNKCNNYSFSLLIMYGSSYMFRHYIASLGSVPIAFWEMLNWGAADRILWTGVLCLVAWCTCVPRH
jgi:hypothetical protein